MNLANKLTLSRVFIIPFFLVALLPDSFNIPGVAYSSPGVEGFAHPWLRIAALLMFIGAAVTDYYDGVLARRHNWITNFGKLFDPLADKLIVMAAFVGMVELRVFSSWMVILVLCREFLITGLRTMAVGQGRVLGADRWGKNKTISQMTVIITALVYICARDLLTLTGHWNEMVVKRWGLAAWLGWTLHLMMFLCVVLTVYSGWRYCWENRDIIAEDLK